MANEKKTAFMCGVDWQHEVGETKCALFQSKEACEAGLVCTDECGIAEVKVTFVRWAKPQKLLGKK